MDWKKTLDSLKSKNAAFLKHFCRFLHWRPSIFIIYITQRHYFLTIDCMEFLLT